MSTFLRIIGQVEDGQRIGGTTVGRLVTVGIELANIDGTDIVVGELVKVTLDVSRRQTGRAVGEQRIYRIPCQQGSVEAAEHRVFVRILTKLGRNAGEHPRLGLRDGDAARGILEVVNVGGVILRTTGGSRNELCKLTREGNL